MSSEQPVPSWRDFAIPVAAIAIVLAASLMFLGNRASSQQEPGEQAPYDAETAVPMVDCGVIGSFAMGYLEFDWNPAAPGGVPSFDTWPPGSGCR